jgi:hypothetical protein
LVEPGVESVSGGAVEAGDLAVDAAFAVSESETFWPPRSFQRNTNDLARLRWSEGSIDIARVGCAKIGCNAVACTNGPDRWYFGAYYREAGKRNPL